MSTSLPGSPHYNMQVIWHSLIWVVSKLLAIYNIYMLDGYMKFKFATGLPFIGRLLRRIINDPLCPNDKDSAVMHIGKPMPVVIFSHGLGAMRTTYSILLTELASQGYFVAAVEHKDGSASATLNSDGTWTYERKIQPQEDEYAIRNSQLNQRAEECRSVYHLLHQLSNTSSSLSQWQLLVPSDQFQRSIGKANLDMTNGCFISGHSFGGVTALKTIYTSSR